MRFEHFDDGVIHQLTSKRTEAEAVEAVRSIRQYELSNIQHMAAYINHVIKHYNPAAGESGTASSGMVSSQPGFQQHSFALKMVILHPKLMQRMGALVDTMLKTWLVQTLVWMYLRAAVADFSSYGWVPTALTSSVPQGDKQLRR